MSQDERPTQIEIAGHYGDWVRRHMEARGWGQAMLVRRSGLPKQTISVIVNGEARHPTAGQVAGLAHAFGVDPNEIFRAIGLWGAGVDDETVPAQLRYLYASLNQPARRAALEHLRVVRELQSEYEAIRDDALREPVDVEPAAASNNEDMDRARRRED